MLVGVIFPPPWCQGWGGQGNAAVTSGGPLQPCMSLGPVALYPYKNKAGDWPQTARKSKKAHVKLPARPTAHDVEEERCCRYATYRWISAVSPSYGAMYRSVLCACLGHQGGHLGPPGSSFQPLAYARAVGWRRPALVGHGVGAAHPGQLSAAVLGWCFPCFTPDIQREGCGVPNSTKWPRRTWRHPEPNQVLC